MKKKNHKIYESQTRLTPKYNTGQFFLFSIAPSELEFSLIFTFSRYPLWQSHASIVHGVSYTISILTLSYSQLSTTITHKIHRTAYIYTPFYLIFPALYSPKLTNTYTFFCSSSHNFQFDFMYSLW